MTKQPMYLPNPFYAALTTANEPFAAVHSLARRYKPDIVPFGAVVRPNAEAFKDLVPLLMAGEEIYLTLDAGETMSATSGLMLVSSLPCLQMRFIGAPFEETNDPMVIPLGRANTDEILDLKLRAFPGFFGRRAPELGNFFGIRDPASGRLVAMGGERLATYRDREMSAICTDPEHSGKGYAARLVRTIVRHQAYQGSSSLLHVTATNKRAIALYEHLGFRTTGSLAFIKLKRV